MVVLCLDDVIRSRTQRECDGQRFAQSLDALVLEAGERGSSLIVNDLHDAEKIIGMVVDDGADQHLLGAIPGPTIHFLQEAQVRADSLELRFIIDITDIDDLTLQGDVTRNALVGNRQLEILERVQSRLDLGNDRASIFADCINGQSIGIEQGADILRQLEHDLLDVRRRMNLVGHCLQVLEEGQATAQFPGAQRIDVMSHGRRAQDRAHATALSIPSNCLSPPSSRVA